MKADICVVGGGPAGLAAAVALAQSEREVTVVDSAVPPINKACGEGLLPDGLAALETLGITVGDAGTSLLGIRFFDSDSGVSADFPNGIGRGMRRILLHELLVKRAERAGVRLLWGVKGVHTRRGRVSFSGGSINTNLIVGADGLNSSVRLDAGLGGFIKETRRYGFRRHFLLAPWSRYVELYWGQHFQIYVTPVAADQVCVALISTDPHMRLDAALPQLPALSARLKAAAPATSEKGSLSVSRTLRRVCTDGYVLLGDASGSVDAITGEGMCLAFKQSVALVRALDANDLGLYQQSHRKISTHALRMASLMLVLDTNRTVQRKALAGLAAHPQVLSSILAAHVGHQPLTSVVSWRLLPFGFGALFA